MRYSKEILKFPVENTIWLMLDIIIQTIFYILNKIFVYIEKNN